MKMERHVYVIHMLLDHVDIQKRLPHKIAKYDSPQEGK
jgi:hypothetical protein